MALVVQNDQGTAAGANAYVAVAFFKSYHDDRGNSYAGKSDAEIEKAIVKATDYLDTRFRFRGNRMFSTDSQTTEWPRYNAKDDSGYCVDGIPPAVKKACCEYALRALSKNINPDPVGDETGQAVKRISKTAGPVSKDIEYANPGTLSLPKYPVADRMLAAAGLLVNTSVLVRA